MKQQENRQACIQNKQQQTMHMNQIHKHKHKIKQT